ncbi:hypothetical protein [Streptomyces chartreusis]|uniref:hypothetical protein n=1 Tax=Streptomyces chartreusis TaxID=1969 RepID=UPI003827C006
MFRMKSVAAVAVVGIATGGFTAAPAAADGLLLDDISLVLSCSQFGQVGDKNTFQGTLTQNCTQSSSPQGNGGGGLTGYQVVEGEILTLEPSQGANPTATCPAGKRATGGGFAANSNVTTFASGTVDGQTWVVNAINNSDRSGMVRAIAVCANVV